MATNYLPGPAQWEKFILGLPATLKEDMAYRKKLFFEADADHDGKVTEEELRAFLADVGLSPATVHNLVKVADLKGDGKLCLEAGSPAAKFCGR